MTRRLSLSGYRFIATVASCRSGCSHVILVHCSEHEGIALMRYSIPVIGVLVVWLACGATSGQTTDPPWKEPQDTAQALNEPDRYAWRLFVALNWPAEIAKQQADPNKAFGAEGS